MIVKITNNMTLSLELAIRNGYLVRQFAGVPQVSLVRVR